MPDADEALLTIARYDKNLGTTISEIKWSNSGKPVAEGIGHRKECHDGQCIESAGSEKLLLDQRTLIRCGDVPFFLYRRLRVQSLAQDGSKLDPPITIPLHGPKDFC